jgi:farnesyl diphosphate synthase
MELQTFLDFLPKIYSILETSINSQFPDFCYPHIKELLDYNLQGGKCIRGLIAVHTFLELSKVDPQSEKASIGYVLGWAIEVLHSSFLVADDLMDQSLTRRNRQCYYLKENVGDMALNEAVLIENCCFILLNSLQSLFNLDDFYNLIKLFRQVIFYTAIGQTIDFYPNSISFPFYYFTSKHKTTFYSFFLPFHSAIIASGVQLDFSKFDQLIEEIGLYFQIQDDWIDIFEDSNISGKIGTDLIENKNNWCVCKFYQIADEEIKQEFTKLFLEKKAENISQLKTILVKSGIVEVYKQFVQEISLKISSMIQKFSDEFPVKTISLIWNQINASRKR